MGEYAWVTLTALIAMGDLLQDEGKPDEAEAWFREALEKSRQALGPDDRFTLTASAHLGVLLVTRNRNAEAEELLARLEAKGPSAMYTEDASAIGTAVMALGMARLGQGKFAAAETDLLEAQSMLVMTNSPRGKFTRRCTQGLVDLYIAWNAAQPGNGKGVKATEWKRRLDALGAAVSTVRAH
jgi:hypothetical protein